MREKTNGQHPRFILWENVAGAFSSNNGKDFREVLQQIFNITEDNNTAIPQSETWNNAGAVLGNNCSITWRLFDAQFWGVPQRRRRIFLMADFAGGADLTPYYLSQKACMGILERCRKRGKRRIIHLNVNKWHSISFVILNYLNSRTKSTVTFTRN